MYRGWGSRRLHVLGYMQLVLTVPATCRYRYLLDLTYSTSNCRESNTNGLKVLYYCYYIWLPYIQKLDVRSNLAFEQLYVLVEKRCTVARQRIGTTSDGANKVGIADVQRWEDVCHFTIAWRASGAFRSPPVSMLGWKGHPSQFLVRPVTSHWARDLLILLERGE